MIAANPRGKTLIVLRVSRKFRKRAGNASNSLPECVAQPLSMLMTAPFLVYKLDLQQYGSALSNACSANWHVGEPHPSSVGGQTSGR
jgi:hypothetical protein